MTHLLSPLEKQNLLKLIVSAGLEEDFMKWLERQGHKYIFGRLDNIPDELVLAYINERKLMDFGEDEYKIYTELGDIEPESMKKFIPARRR